MPHDFDVGYGGQPWASLVADYPDDAYPPADFRVEWGPIFHRGRLDGSARVLVLGQDPGPHEAFVRRILVGEAGQRAQGLMTRLGIERGYVMVNTYLYSVYGQQAGERHAGDPAIAAYRHRWLDALLAGGQVQAVIAFGHLADKAFRTWRATPAGHAYDGAYEHLTHPTQPDASARGGGPSAFAAAMKKMLADWNAALPRLHAAITDPDAPRDLVLYGDHLTAADHTTIPLADLPAGTPPWMTTLENWASRSGADAEAKRANLTIVVPPDERPWRQG
jgi:hypothetical protein